MYICPFITLNDIRYYRRNTCTRFLFHFSDKINKINKIVLDNDLKEIKWSIVHGVRYQDRYMQRIQEQGCIAG